MRRGRTWNTGSTPLVSIHAPREGCDVARRAKARDTARVSIHAPREGCDSASPTDNASSSSFNSRTPGGVRHKRRSRTYHAPGGFNSRTPGGVRQPPAPRRFGCTSSFNSRTPGGVRRELRLFVEPTCEFQFTHPGRGATDVCFLVYQVFVVSIHAPREGCDNLLPEHLQTEQCFNSRTPGGVRQCGAKLRIIGRINKRNLRKGEMEREEGDTLFALGLVMWLITSACG